MLAFLDFQVERCLSGLILNENIFENDDTKKDGLRTKKLQAKNTVLYFQPKKSKKVGKIVDTPWLFLQHFSGKIYIRVLLIFGLLKSNRLNPSFTSITEKTNL